MSANGRYDVLVIGAGPAGQAAALEAAGHGCRVGLVERVPSVGGECVRFGTIPSKSLREAAIRYRAAQSQPIAFDIHLRPGVPLDCLIGRVEATVEAHVRYQSERLERAGVELIHGRARFLAADRLAVQSITGAVKTVHGDTIIVATGSRPRQPADIPIDHEHILDSDSILSMAVLPESMTVVGGGVIACEYAAIFALLGVDVTILDRGERPLSFLDPELSDAFRRQFEESGGRYLGGVRLAEVGWNGMGHVITQTEDGRVFRTEKLLAAVGRTAAIAGLDVEIVGLETTARDHLVVNEYFQTTAPNIYAVGDITGPPALAATGIQQGRVAARHALGLPTHRATDFVPVGIYTIPEIASIGLDEPTATKEYGDILVGRAHFSEVARAHIHGSPDGLLKLIVAPDGRTMLGAQIVGHGATELISVAQMAIQEGCPVDRFVESVFNFPTLAEAYRMAALDVIEQRRPEAHATPRLRAAGDPRAA